MTASSITTVVFFTYDARSHFARLDRHRLIHDTLLFRVVAHFHVAGQREILAERIADKAIVSQDAAQVGMSGKYDAIQIEGLALVPVGAWPDVRDGFQYREIVILGKDTHPQAHVMCHRQQVIDDSETPA